MSTPPSKADLKRLKRTLQENIHPSVMERVLTTFMQVEVPLEADEEWVAERLSEEILAKGSITLGS